MGQMHEKMELNSRHSCLASDPIGSLMVVQWVYIPRVLTADGNLLGYYP